MLDVVWTVIFLPVEAVQLRRASTADKNRARRTETIDESAIGEMSGRSTFHARGLHRE